VLLIIAAAITLVATHPRLVLVILAYSYLASAFIGMAISRVRHRGGRPADEQPIIKEAADSRSA
jgi:multisubunit Na+/H+ antiporter MnhG subunit